MKNVMGKLFDLPNQADHLVIRPEEKSGKLYSDEYISSQQLVYGPNPYTGCDQYYIKSDYGHMHKMCPLDDDEVKAFLAHFERERKEQDIRNSKKKKEFEFPTYSPRTPESEELVGLEVENF